LLLHPDHIVWDGMEYVPDHFPVEAIVWNPNENASASSASATESIWNAISGLPGPVQIVSPGQTQWLLSDGGRIDSTVSTCGSAFATWEDTVLPNVLTDCTTDSSYDISVSLSASGVPQPIFSGSCVCPIIVDCKAKQNVSTIPILTVLSRTGSYDGSICNARTIHAGAYDPRMCASCFVKSVSALHLQNMTFAIEDSSSWTYELSVIDSMQNGSATVFALDNTGDWDTAQYTYCTILDTHAPVLYSNPVEDTCACFSFSITDTQAWDRGLDSLAIYNLNNMVIDTIYPNGLNVRGLRQADPWGHFVGQPSGLCITVIDGAGNRLDTCLSLTNAGVEAAANRAFALSVAPNPSSGSVTISLTGAPSANIEIFDVLGRQVANFRVAGSYEWQTGLLPAGAYIVRASIGDAVVSKQMLKR
ncbi:MAG: T9SS type A sorting domain-containing protein, partial [Candidatus Kapaibacterium sp.]